MFEYFFNMEKESRPKYSLHKVESKKYELTGIVE